MTSHSFRTGRLQRDISWRNSWGLSSSRCEKACSISTRISELAISSPRINAPRRWPKTSKSTCFAILTPAIPRRTSSARMSSRQLSARLIRPAHKVAPSSAWLSACSSKICRSTKRFLSRSIPSNLKVEIREASAASFIGVLLARRRRPHGPSGPGGSRAAGPDGSSMSMLARMSQVSGGLSFWPSGRAPGSEPSRVSQQAGRHLR